jgi:hypothetical protein
MDIHDLKKVTDFVQDGLVNLVRDKKIVDYSATVSLGEETVIDVAYILIKPVKFIKVDVKLSRVI